jgi:alpha-tubulin suppressor-like RCC1 family protein
MAPVPHKMDPCPFSPDKPKELVCSSGFSAAVTESGAVYTWGSGEFGRLGYYDATRRQSVPK